MWALVRDTAGVSSALDPIVAALERRPDLRGLGAGELARVLGVPIASAVATLRALGGETWDRALVRAGRPAPVVQLGDLRARARARGDDAGLYDVSPAVPLPPGTTTPYVRALPLAKAERVRWPRPQGLPPQLDAAIPKWENPRLPTDPPNSDPRFMPIEVPQNPVDLAALREALGWSQVQIFNGDNLHNAPYHDLNEQAMVFAGLRQWSPLPEDQQLPDTDTAAPWYGWHGHGDVRFVYGWKIGDGANRYRVGQWMQVQKYEANPVPQGADPPWVPGSKGGRWYIFSSGGVDRIFTRWSGAEPWVSQGGFSEWWTQHEQDVLGWLADAIRVAQAAMVTVFTLGAGSAAVIPMALTQAAQAAMLASAQAFARGDTGGGLLKLGEMLLKLGSIQISDSATIADAIGKSSMSMASPVMAGAWKFIAKIQSSDVGKLVTEIVRDVRGVADVTRPVFQEFTKLLPPSERHYAELGWQVGTTGSVTLDQVRALVPWYAASAFDSGVVAGAIDQAQHYPPIRASSMLRAPVRSAVALRRFAPMPQARPVIEGSAAPGIGAAVPLVVGGGLAAWFLL